jgi:hypothetical protein
MPLPRGRTVCTSTGHDARVVRGEAHLDDMGSMAAVRECRRLLAAAVHTRSSQPTGASRRVLGVYSRRKGSAAAAARRWRCSANLLYDRWVVREAHTARVIRRDDPALCAVAQPAHAPRAPTTPNQPTDGMT